MGKKSQVRKEERRKKKAGIITSQSSTISIQQTLHNEERKQFEEQLVASLSSSINALSETYKEVATFHQAVEQIYFFAEEDHQINCNELNSQIEEYVKRIQIVIDGLKNLKNEIKLHPQFAPDYHLLYIKSYLINFRLLCAQYEIGLVLANHKDDIEKEKLKEKLTELGLVFDEQKHKNEKLDKIIDAAVNGLDYLLNMRKKDIIKIDVSMLEGLQFAAEFIRENSYHRSDDHDFESTFELATYWLYKFGRACKEENIVSIQLMYPFINGNLATTQEIKGFKERCDDAKINQKNNPLTEMIINNMNFWLDHNKSSRSIYRNNMTTKFDLLAKRSNSPIFQKHLSFESEQMKNLIIPILNQLQAKDAEIINSASESISVMRKMGFVIGDITHHLKNSYLLIEAWINKIEKDQKQDIPDEPLSLDLMKQIKKELNFILGLVNQFEPLMDAYQDISAWCFYNIERYGTYLFSDLDVELLIKKIGEIEEIFTKKVNAYEESKPNKKNKDNPDNQEDNVEEKILKPRPVKKQKDLSNNNNAKILPECKKEIISASPNQTIQKKTETENNYDELIKIKNKFIYIHSSLVPIMRESELLIDKRLSRDWALKTREHNLQQGCKAAMDRFSKELTELIDSYRKIYSKCKKEIHNLNLEELEGFLKTLNEKYKNVGIKMTEINKKWDLLPSHSQQTYHNKCLDEGKKYVKSDPQLKKIAPMLTEDVVIECGKDSINTQQEIKWNQFKTPSNHLKEPGMINTMQTFFKEVTCEIKEECEKINVTLNNK